jgi:ABC-type amino acid transport substrate-binding protein
MHKNLKLFLLIIILVNIFVFCSGCIDSQNDVDPALQKIKDAGKLVLGTSTPYEPMEYVDEYGDIVGFDIDLAHAIADSLGVDLEIRDMDFDILLNKVISGEIDIAIAAITINSERSEKVSFSKPYFNAGQIVIVNLSNENITSPEKLYDKKVGVQNGTTSKQEAEVYTNSSLVITFDDYSEAVDQLINGNIDAVIIDYPAGFALVSEYDNLKIVGDPFTNEFYGVAIKNGNTALKTKIDTIINSYIIDDIKEKWF